MIKEFIDYTYQIFPSIDTNVKNGIKDLIGQYDTFKPNWFSDTLEILSQGDIIDSLPFLEYDDEGNEIPFMTKGMILSNTCDLTRDKNIIVAPLIPFKNDFKPATRDAIKNNLVSGKMCLSCCELEDFYIDFSMSTSFPRSVIMNLYEEKKINRVHSLSQFGFYFLCSKVAIYYLRVENYDNFDLRSKDMFIEE